MDLNTVNTVATTVIIAFVVIGVLAAIIIKKIIGKILSLLLAAAVVFSIWQQRTHVINYADDIKGQVCSAQSHFFGITVMLPADWCK
ncbi:MAG: hypothetical protein M3Z00_03800 [Actinomycetota bacterium]|nr:hypothetical protein [Actinomycetota bacterium]